MFKKIILFCALIMLSMQFSNTTGGYIPKREIQIFEQIVHQASLYFVSDVSQHTRYIQQKMDYLFGSKMYTYFVYVQTTNGYSYINGNWIKSQIVQRSGINKINKSWSYMLGKVWRSNEKMRHISGVGKGNGFNETDEQNINNIIASIEKDDYCRCAYYSSDIWKSLNQLYDNKISIICSKYDDTNMYIAPMDDKWLVTKAMACFYSIYLAEGYLEY